MINIKGKVVIIFLALGIICVVVLALMGFFDNFDTKSEKNGARNQNNANVECKCPCCSKINDEEKDTVILRVVKDRVDE